MRLRTGNSKLDRTDVPLSDLLRRLGLRGIHTEPFEDGYVLSQGLTFEFVFLEDPVPEAEVLRIAEIFELDKKLLYFDRSERDYS